MLSRSAGAFSISKAVMGWLDRSIGRMVPRWLNTLEREKRGDLHHSFELDGILEGKPNQLHGSWERGDGMGKVTPGFIFLFAYITGISLAPPSY